MNVTKKAEKNLVVLLSAFALLWRIWTWSSIDFQSVLTEGPSVNFTMILGIMGLSIVILGFAVYWKYKSDIAFAFFLYCFAMAIHWGSHPKSEAVDQDFLLSLYTYLSIFLGSSILHFSRIFPESRQPSKRGLLLIYMPGIIGFVLLLGTFIEINFQDMLLIAEPLFVNLFALIGAIILFSKFFKSSANRINKRGLGIVCTGILLANLPYTFSEFIPALNFAGYTDDLIYRLLFALQPIAFAIGVVKVSVPKG